MSTVCSDVYICVDMFSHHETNNIFEIRCVVTIFWHSVFAFMDVKACRI
jgi:hypothetical protein